MKTQDPWGVKKALEDATPQKPKTQMWQNLQKLFSILLFIVGIVLSLYLGLWVCFIGGIVMAIDSIKLTPVDASGLALGILRILSTGIIFWICIAVIGYISNVFWPSRRKKKPGRL
jgi:uncharacterized BrkB/YihY/UPF0761 family membrane protein